MLFSSVEYWVSWRETKILFLVEYALPDGVAKGSSSSDHWRHSVLQCQSARFVYWVYYSVHVYIFFHTIQLCTMFSLFKHIATIFSFEVSFIKLNVRHILFTLNRFYDVKLVVSVLVSVLLPWMFFIRKLNQRLEIFFCCWNGSISPASAPKWTHTTSY
jgi:hypothetical protein